MRALPRFLLILGPGSCLPYVLLHEARLAQNNPDTDASKIVLLFIGTVLIGGAAAIVVATMVMPRIGDTRSGNSSSFAEPADREDPHSADASRGGSWRLRRRGRGVPDRCIESDPADTLSYSEIAKICCEHLDDAPGAAEVPRGQRSTREMGAQ